MTTSLFRTRRYSRYCILFGNPSMSRHNHSRISVAVSILSACLVGNLPSPTCAFALVVRPPSHCMHSPTLPIITTSLNLAKGGVHGKKTRMINATVKKKKTSNPNAPGKHRKTSKRDRPSSGGDDDKSNRKQSTTPTTRPKLSILGTTKKNAPPWQVLGEKDMKKNVEAEIIRRERIKLGIDSSSAGNTNKESFRADVSGSNKLISPSDRIMLNWKRFNPVSTPSDLSLVGAYLEKRLPPSLGVPEVAFLGRSNVGKSSLLNKLVAKVGGDTARVGKTPGATAAVNLYALLGQPKRKGGSLITGAGGAKPILGFADLPGFGFAKLSKETKESVEDTAELYLGKRRELSLGILLVDSRRIPNEDDRAVLAALFDMGVPLIVVATKIDKLKPSEVELAMAEIRDGLGLPDGQPLRISCVTGEGIRELWRIILDACESRVEELKLAIEEGRDDGGVMRMALDEDDDENSDFYDDYEDEDGDEEGEYFDDDEDLVYDQGYDWVQNDARSDNNMDDVRDNFYEGDQFIEDDDFVDEAQWSDRTEKESFKLKNLKKRVDEMERRGEI